MIEISKEQTLQEYCKGQSVYISTNSRSEWRLPPSYFFGSHAPVEDLFYRSVPKTEGTVHFYKEEN